jgi:predicted AlkP superfamily pyrophosphatase or phosphodiesterase
MILHNIGDLILKERTEGEFVYPYYDKFCVSNIPPFILSFFNIKSPRPVLPLKGYRDRLNLDDSMNVLMFLVDGLSYNYWIQQTKEIEVCNLLGQKGIVAPLTSVFPSTTAAALTTINSGLTPQEHGLLEWIIYVREIDMIIKTLRFTSIDSNTPDSLLEKEVDPKLLFKGRTLYQQLDTAGVNSVTFVPESIAYSTYSQLIHKGSLIIPYSDLLDLFKKIVKKLKQSEETYFYVYIDTLDYVGHQFGPHSNQYLKEFSTFSSLLIKGFINKVETKIARKTIFLLTSDHGQIPVSPTETLYLNNYLKLTRNLQNPNRRRVYPTGSPRDVFLHIEPDRLEEIHDYLVQELSDQAYILKVTDALEMNLFGGGQTHNSFHDRIGNLLILPRGNHTIWFEHVKGEKFGLKGHHGGLHKEEMLIPFAAANLANLI